MEKILKFYDSLFLYHYDKLKDKERDPEVMPIVIITVGQSTNFLIIYLLASYFFDLDKYLPIKYSIFVWFIVFLGLNIYIYIVKGRKNIVLKKREELENSKTGIKSAVYLVSSIIAPLVLIYIINEFGNGFH